jgi:hypothetical protein
VDGVHDLAINVQRVPRGAAIHVIRYDYGEARDEVPILQALTVRIRLPGAWRTASAFAPSGRMDVSLGGGLDDAGRLRLELRDVPLYSIVLLEH